MRARRLPSAWSDVARKLRREPGVGRRCQVQEALLVGTGEVQRIDENAQRLTRDALAARQRLQLLVGFGQAVAAHHGLDRFGEHFPGYVEVGNDAVAIDFELAEALFERGESDQRVA